MSFARHLSTQVLVLALACALASPSASADDELEKAAWVLPALASYVVVHEASHFGAARVVGGQPRFDFVPSWRSLARVHVRKPGGLSTGEYALISVAPIVTDLALIGGYVALTELTSVSDNKHMHIPLTIVTLTASSDVLFQAFPLHPAVLRRPLRRQPDIQDVLLELAVAAAVVGADQR
ncbi:MAG: hypothetical protein KJO07_09415 [Deltaproteobacteria bacterium]|nr:hypothetical protein [Deltaproteobacteria bacterium]